MYESISNCQLYGPNTNKNAFPRRLLYSLVIFLRMFAFSALGHKMQTKVVKTI